VQLVVAAAISDVLRVFTTLFNTSSLVTLSFNLISSIHPFIYPSSPDPHFKGFYSLVVRFC